jgi:DmX-like protein
MFIVILLLFYIENTRYHMYYWLERETQILKELDCPAINSSFGDTMQVRKRNENSISDDLIIASENNLNILNQPSLLHEQVINDQRLFQAKIQRLNKRKEWLRSNELLLRTFLSYCSLHSSREGKYHSIKVCPMLIKLINILKCLSYLKLVLHLLKWNCCF